MSSILADQPIVQQLQVRVITPHSGVEGFSYAIKALWRDKKQSFSLAWRLFVRDTRAEHRQSVLGYVWLVVPALTNTLVWVFLNNQNVINVNSGSVPYPVFVLAGAVLWAAFNASLMAMLGVIAGSRTILAKVNFPHEALVYAGVFKALTDAIIAAALLIPALLIFRVHVSAETLLFVPALIGTLLVGSAIGLLIMPIAALYGDVSRVMQLILRFGFFLTPVIFPLPGPGHARRLMLLNPVASLIVSGRSWLAGSGETFATGSIAVTGGALVFFFIGLLFYKVALPHLIERLSS